MTMTTLTRPLHDRDAEGRHRVDFRQIKSPILRYGLALLVVAGVVGAAVWSWHGVQPVTDAAALPWIPWLGGGVLGVVALGLILQWIGPRR